MIPIKASEAPSMVASAPDKAQYTHEAMIDYILTNPGVQQKDIAKHFGMTQNWVCVVLNSDAFQALFESRRKELVDPSVMASIEEKMKATAQRSLDIILDKLNATNSAEMALKALELTSKSLGYGAAKQQTNVQNNFVIALPSKSKSATEWAQEHKPTPGGITVIEG